MRFSVVLFTSILTLSIAVVTSETQRTFILLVAGSKGWRNYRHQADVCHAYQTFRYKGIPQERIVVMMYDDIAYNPKNKHPGVVMNNINGSNVYTDVPRDYTGKDVNTDVFLAVLQGDKERVTNLTGKQHGKVISSGPNDNIFVFYSDHGGYGVVGMPQGRMLFGEELTKTFKKMHKGNKYSAMVVYIEACHSGSMFANVLPEDINVYAVTAANAEESSWGFHFDKEMHAFLGDLFSTSWMEYMDTRNLTSETFGDQYDHLLQATNRSHPQQFGDMEKANMTLRAFLGNTSTQEASNSSNQDISNSLLIDQQGDIEAIIDAIPSEKIPLESLHHRINAIAAGTPLREELENELKQMEYTYQQTINIYMKISQTLESGTRRSLGSNTISGIKESIQDFGCHRQVVENLIDACPKLDANNNPTFLSNLHVVVNLCNHHPQQKVLAAVEAATRSTPFCLE